MLPLLKKQLCTRNQLEGADYMINSHLRYWAKKYSLLVAHGENCRKSLKWW